MQHLAITPFIRGSGFYQPEFYIAPPGRPANWQYRYHEGLRRLIPNASGDEFSEAYSPTPQPEPYALEESPKTFGQKAGGFLRSAAQTSVLFSLIPIALVAVLIVGRYALQKVLGR